VKSETQRPQKNFTPEVAAKLLGCAAYSRIENPHPCAANGDKQCGNCRGDSCGVKFTQRAQKVQKRKGRERSAEKKTVMYLLAPLEIHGLKFYLKDAEKRKMADVFVKGCSCGRGRIGALSLTGRA